MTKRQRIIKAIEAKGYHNVEAFYASISRGCEMQGDDGGWFITYREGDDYDIIEDEPVGYNFAEAMAWIDLMPQNEEAEHAAE